MRKLKLIVFILCINFFSSAIVAQVSLSALKSAGINSEEDLTKLGVSSTEINRAKEEYFQKNNQEGSSGATEVDEEIKKENVKNISEQKLILSPPSITTDDEIYGQSLFRSGSVNVIENSDRIKAPDDYVLVSGDKINITIWGYSEFSAEFILDDLGNITPKLVGRINLKGKDFKTVREIIKSKFGRVYDLKNSQIAIELSYSKIISVNVAGEVKKPGSYAVPSLNSAYNILALAGGPTEVGSIREIEIRRNGNLINVLDFYNFMLSPESFKSQYLQDGDFIIVRLRKGTIEIKGEVKRAGKYEFKNGDKFSDIMKYCGGFSAMADSSSVNIVRIEGSLKKMISLEDLASKTSDFEIKNGDEIEVLSVSPLVRNSVSIRGAVNVAGHFSFKEGDKISDLLTKASGVTYQAFDEIAHLYRTNEDLSYEIKSFNLGAVLKNQNSSQNLELKEFDQILIFNKDSFLNDSYVIVDGFVNITGRYTYKKGMVLSDLVLLANGFKNGADINHIEIERVLENNFGTDSLSINLISVSYPVDRNVEIKEFDRIIFRQISGYELGRLVTIEGEIRHPGTYTLLGKDDNVLDLIKRSGGLTEFAYLSNARIVREEAGVGLLLLDLDKVFKDENSKYNFRLKPGDKIIIPKVKDVVSISGAIGYTFVNNNSEEINSPFHKGKRASFYIKKYGGGYDKKAKKREVYVIRESGLVVESRFFGLIKPKVERGDKIVVSYKEEKVKKESEEKIDWNNAIESGIVKITGILTLYILLDRIN